MDFAGDVIGVWSSALVCWDGQDGKWGNGWYECTLDDCGGCINDCDAKFPVLEDIHACISIIIFIVCISWWRFHPASSFLNSRNCRSLSFSYSICNLCLFSYDSPILLNSVAASFSFLTLLFDEEWFPLVCSFAIFASISLGLLFFASVIFFANVVRTEVFFTIQDQPLLR